MPIGQADGSAIGGRVGRRDKDPEKIIRDLFDYVRQYGDASNAVEDVQGSAPRTQIRGQWIELALKTYLAAVGYYVEGHNLVDLAQRCTDRGLKLDETDLANVIDKLNRMYAKFDPLDWDYPSRYPMEDRPNFAWVTPGHQQVKSLVDRIIQQATESRARQ